MFKLDNAFLEELGLGSLPPAEKNKMLAHIYETLEMRVGVKLAEQMTEEQLTEFEQYISAQDEAGALKWLELNFPNYKQVVADQLEVLKSEIKQVSEQIVAQAAQNAASSPQPQMPPQVQPQQMPPANPATYPAAQPQYSAPSSMPTQLAPDSQMPHSQQLQPALASHLPYDPAYVPAPPAPVATPAYPSQPRPQPQPMQQPPAQQLPHQAPQEPIIAPYQPPSE